MSYFVIQCRTLRDDALSLHDDALFIYADTSSLYAVTVTLQVDISLYAGT